VTGAPYSPQLRTGVLLTGVGTAGAYHAGALRALVEGGIKIDVIAAHGAGVLTALATAVDGGPRVWDSSGPWTDPRLRHAYRWRFALRAAWVGLLASIALLLSPLLVLVLAAVVYGAATLAALVSATGTAASLVATYQGLIEALFDPPILPTILPRLLVLAVFVIVAVLAVAAYGAARHERSRRRVTGAFWWRLLSSPLDAAEPAATCLDTLWRLVGGAAAGARPALPEIGRRYVDVLADNFGQPGFHEVIVAVHDLDARRDLVGGILAAPARAAFEAHRDEADADGSLVDLTGPQRDTLASFVAGACRLPIGTDPGTLEFAFDSYWRGERHRVADRPELAVRLVDELLRIGVEQIIIISPAALPALPSSMRARPIDLRGRVGELVRSMESAALVDAMAVARSRSPAVFVVRPEHNPIGPFDFSGVYDEASDRRLTLAALIEQGRVDGYRHVVEPAVAAEE
jgi:hypothetical protein